jgi:hypothetical protein
MPELGPRFQVGLPGTPGGPAMDKGKAIEGRVSPLSASMSSSAEPPLKETRKRSAKGFGDALRQIAKWSKPRGGKSPAQVRPGGTSEASGSAPTTSLQPRAPSTTGLSVAAPTSATEATKEAQLRAVNEKKIIAALQGVAANPERKVLVHSWSPTGGGHEERGFKPIRHALKEGELAAGDVAVFHVPDPWNNRTRPAGLYTLADSLIDRGVHVFYLEGDKSVQGYLKDSGGVDHKKTLRRLAMLPKRPPATETSITAANVYSGNPGEFESRRSISAKNLAATMREHLGEQAMRNQVHVSSDMAPDLQKAFANEGTPVERIVDQQNHAIMVMDGDHLSPRKAVYAKVLGGRGRVSHIGFDKNPLKAMSELADQMNFALNTPKEQAHNAIIDRYLRAGRPAVRTSPDQKTQIQGVLYHPSITSARDIKHSPINVYAHNNQNRIFDVFKSRIDAGHPDYKDKLIVFCGSGALTDRGNAMQLGRLDDAHSITTVGFGVASENVYMAAEGGATGKQLLYPIDGHDEQKKVATIMAAHPATHPHVTARTDTDNLAHDIDVFMAQVSASEPAARKQGTMGRMLTALRNPETHEKQTSEMIFKGIQNAEGIRIAEIEKAMRDDPRLTAARHYNKIMFQLEDHLTKFMVPNVSDPMQTRSFDITLKDKDGPHKSYANIKAFRDDFCNDQKLTEMAQSRIPLNSTVVPGLDEARNMINDLVHDLDRKANTDWFMPRLEKVTDAWAHTVDLGF